MEKEDERFKDCAMRKQIVDDIISEVAQRILDDETLRAFASERMGGSLFSSKFVEELSPLHVRPQYWIYYSKNKVRLSVYGVDNMSSEDIDIICKKMTEFIRTKIKNI